MRIIIDHLDVVEGLSGSGISTDGEQKFREFEALTDAIIGTSPQAHLYHYEPLGNQWFKYSTATDTWRACEQPR